MGSEVVLKKAAPLLYFSARLPAQYPHEAAALFAALRAQDVSYALLNGTKDIWVRDFMPVQIGAGKLVSFRYAPTYLAKEPERQTDFRRDMKTADIPPIGGWRPPETYAVSDIRLDGGNVVFSPDRTRVIVSDRVVAENSECSRAALVRALSARLEAEVIVIPSLKSDMTGHADGMVRFVDGQTVVCNRPLSPGGFERRVKDVLENHGLDTVDFPFVPAAGYSAVGCYLNFLETARCVFLPVFGLTEDAAAIAAAEVLFTKTVVPVAIPAIAHEGGGLNCISWDANIPFD